MEDAKGAPRAAAGGRRAQGARGVLRRLRYLAARHAVLLVAAAAALATMAAVPPDGAYLGYLDLRTLGCLFGILAVVAALRHLGVFERAAREVVDRFATCRGAVAALVGATLLLSMVATNDMALLMMLPLAAATLLEAGWARALPVTFVLQNLAANLGGMILPFGNPQNLYLYERFAIPLGDFLATMALPFAVSVALIAGCCALLVPATRKEGAAAEGETAEAEGTVADARPAEGEAAAVEAEGTAAEAEGAATAAGAARPAEGEAAAGAARLAAAAAAPTEPSSRETAGDVCPADARPAPPAPGGQAVPAILPSRRARALVCLALLALMVASVLRLVPWPAAVAAVVAALAVLDRRALAQVDYGLLLTFTCFFVFAGNMARIPAVVDAFAPLMAGGGLWVSAGASQVISNVPAAVLLSHFTGDWAPLLVGVNVGGAGTLVASLAGLITFSHYRSVRALFTRSGPAALPRTRVFLGWFTALGFAFLAVLLAASALALG